MARKEKNGQTHTHTQTEKERGTIQVRVIVFLQRVVCLLLQQLVSQKLFCNLEET